MHAAQKHHSRRLWNHYERFLSSNRHHPATVDTTRPAIQDSCFVPSTIKRPATFES